MDIAAQPTDTVEGLRLKNVKLHLRVSSLQQEVDELRHSLDVALTKASSWAGMRQRMTVHRDAQHKATAEWTTLVQRLGQAGGDDAAHRPDLQSIVEQQERQIASLRSECDASRQEAAAAVEKLKLSQDELRQTVIELEERKQSIVREKAGHPFRDIIEPESLPDRSNETAGKPTKENNVVVAHLMEQIKFLHGEVERLEEVANTVRMESAAEVQEARRQSESQIKKHTEKLEKSKRDMGYSMEACEQIHSLRDRLKAAVTNQHDVKEAQNRVSLQQIEIDQLTEEKRALLTDKHDLQIRVKKLENSVKGARGAGQRLAEHETELATSVDDLRAALSQVTEERDKMAAKVEIQRTQLSFRPTLTQASVQATNDALIANVQTDDWRPATNTISCQVDTTLRGADSVGLKSLSGGASTSITPQVEESVFSLRCAVESKCSELEDVRGELRQAQLTASSLQSEFTRTQTALVEEQARCALLTNECDDMASQVRNMQQHISQQTAMLRERDQRVEAAEEKYQQLLQRATQAEEEHRVMESEMSHSSKDLKQVVAAHHLVNQQLVDVNAENEALRADLQTVLQREAQGQYALRAKEVEIAEILQSYHVSAQENEGAIVALRSLEREADNLRGLLAAREERIAQLQGQVSSLHQREQQLSIDVQSAEYDTQVLHRKVAHSESKIDALQQQLQENQYSLISAERVNNEFERNSAELHKQLAIRENEAAFLRSRCEQVEAEGNSQQSSNKMLRQRVQELEEINARLVVKGVVASSRASRPNTPPHESVSGRQNESLDTVQMELAELKCKAEVLEEQLEAERARRSELETACESLQQQLEDQNTMLGSD